MRRLLSLVLGVGCGLATVAAQQPRFERDVLPIVTAKCLSCHGDNSLVGLDLRTAASLFEGSHNGPVVVKGSAEESLLYKKISSRMMPPEAFKPGFPFWIFASSILRSFSLERKPFLTAGTHRAGPKCFHWTLSFSEGDNSSVGRQFFRHSSELHSAASRFRTRERPFYPLGSGSAQILCSMSPNSLRFRCPSANNNQ